MELLAAQVELLDVVADLADVALGQLAQRGEVELGIEVAGVGHHRAVPHRLEVLAPEHVEVAGRGHEQLAPAGRIGVGHHREPVHQRLEGPDRIDLDDRDVGAVAGHPRRDALADPAVAGDHDLAAGDEHVRRADDAVDRRLARPVAVVEQVLGLGLVDRHDREAECAVGGHRLQPDDAGRRLLGPGEDLLDLVRPLAVEQRHEVAAVVHRDLRDACRRPS